MKKRSVDLVSRRQTLRLIGAAGATALVGWGDVRPSGIWPAGLPGSVVHAGSLSDVLGPALFSPSARVPKAVGELACVARPALTEGPYFVDELLNRSDIRSDPTTGVARAGVPLRLKINVNQVSGTSCAPLPGALVDIWHCDALGLYSDVNAGMGNPDTRGQKFLRGYQVTDNDGSAQFTTIYPGYYTGRSVHIHFKIRLFAGSQRTFEFTSQVFFDDSLTDQVFTQTPYNTKSARGTRNTNGGIYSSQVLLSVTSDGQGGYASTFDIGLTGVPSSVASISTVSAASFSAGVASEGIAALFGAGLADSTISAATQPLPTTLGGVQVRIRDAAGTERAAPLFFVSPGQINSQIPPGTIPGSAVLSVLRNNTAVGQGTAVIDTIAPGLFTANANGQGVAAALVLRVKSEGTQTYEGVGQFDQAQNRFTALPIDLGPSTDRLYLIGFGTGFRYRSSVSGVTATIGGTNADVLFAGAQGSYDGLDQANIAIPRSLAGRGDADLVLRVGGTTANTVSLNIK